MCLRFASRVQRCTVCGCLEASCPGEKQWFRQSGVSASFPDLKRIEFLYVRLITSHVFLLVCFVFCFLAVWHISLVESVHIQINNVLLILGLLICVLVFGSSFFSFIFFPHLFYIVQKWFRVLTVSLWRPSFWQLSPKPGAFTPFLCQRRLPNICLPFTLLKNG